MDSGFATLLGALVGGGATFAASFFQSKTLMRHQRVQAATELAIKEHEFDILLRKEGEKQNYTLLANYVAYHNAALDEISQGNCTPKQLNILATKFGVDAA